MPAAETTPAPLIESRIWLIRGHKVLLDADLAELYQVTTGNLNLAVRRNKERFPEDFMFRLTREEFDNLRLQIARSSWGGRRHPPYAFTEQGIAMLSGVLNSKRAIAVNIAIMRTFVRLRQLLATHEDLARRLEQVEARQNEQGQQIQRDRAAARPSRIDATFAEARKNTNPAAPRSAAPARERPSASSGVTPVYESISISLLTRVLRTALFNCSVETSGRGLAITQKFGMAPSPDCSDCSRNGPHMSIGWSLYTPSSQPGATSAMRASTPRMRMRSSRMLGSPPNSDCQKL
jgi:hypothetical protein